MSAPRTASMQVVRGEPTDEELAALVAVLAELSGAAAAPPPVARRNWADPAHRLRAPLRPGPGAWRVSLRDHGMCAW